MNVSVEEQSPTRKTMVVEMSADDVAEQEKALLSEFRKQARIPGFRPGKAPDRLVKSTYKKEFKADLNQRVLSEAFQKGVEEAGLEVFGVIDREVDDFAEVGSGTARIIVDVRPEFEVPEYQGLEVDELPTDVTEDEVEKAIEEMRNQRADYKVVERAAQVGDFVKCGYLGKIDGKSVEEEIEGLPPLYGTQNATWEEAGSEDAPGVQAIVQGLVGMKAGERKEVTETFPQDFDVEALQGKSVDYQIEVQEVREKVLPEIDEGFLKSLDVESEEQLRERVRQSLEQQKSQRNDQQQRQQAQQKLLEAVDFPIPESAMQTERDNILREYMQRAMQQGASREDFEVQKEELMEGAEKAARDRVKLRLILSRIAEQEKIEATNDDLSQMVMRQAMMNRQKPDELVKELQKDRSRVDEMRQEIIFGKTLDLLQEKAVKTPVSEDAGKEEPAAS